MRGRVTLETTSGDVSNAKVIDVSYLIVDALYLVLKYLLPIRLTGMIRRDQQIAKECCLSVLGIEREELSLVDAPP